MVLIFSSQIIEPSIIDIQTQAIVKLLIKKDEGTYRRLKKPYKSGF